MSNLNVINGVTQEDSAQIVVGSSGSIDVINGGQILNDGVQAAHVADPTDLATCITAITAIIDILEGIGASATS